MLRPAVALTLICSALAAPAWGCADLAEVDAAALTLAQAQARVGDCHPEVRAMRAALAGAVADVRVAGQLPNPQLTLGAGSISRSLGSGPLWNKTFDHSARIDQLFERGGKPALRRAGAQAARDAALADLADARRRALSAVAHAHVDLWAGQGRHAHLVEAAALSADSLRLLDQRVRAGDAPALDASRFRLDDARLRADLRQAEADTQDLRRQLALLIGASPVAARLQPVAPDLSEDAPAVPAAPSIDRRPDVVAAAARVQAAERARDLAAAASTRDVSAGFQFNRYPTSENNGNGIGNTVSISVTVPLFVHHANEGELARAEADLTATREALRRVRDAADAERARADAMAAAAQERRRLVVEQLEPAAAKVAAGAELAYRRGASSALELLDARRSLRSVRQERLAADAELAKALADRRAAVLAIDLITPN